MKKKSMSKHNENDPEFPIPLLPIEGRTEPYVPPNIKDDEEIPFRRKGTPMLQGEALYHSVKKMLEETERLPPDFFKPLAAIGKKKIHTPSSRFGDAIHFYTYDFYGLKGADDLAALVNLPPFEVEHMARGEGLLSSWLKLFIFTDNMTNVLGAMLSEELNFVLSEEATARLKDEAHAVAASGNEPEIRKFIGKHLDLYRQHVMECSVERLAEVLSLEGGTVVKMIQGEQSMITDWFRFWTINGCIENVIESTIKEDDLCKFFLEEGDRILSKIR